MAPASCSPDRDDTYFLRRPCPGADCLPLPFVRGGVVVVVVVVVVVGGCVVVVVDGPLVVVVTAGSVVVVVDVDVPVVEGVWAVVSR